MSVNTETSAQSKQTEHIFIDTYSMDCIFYLFTFEFNSLLCKFYGQTLQRVFLLFFYDYINYYFGDFNLYLVLRVGLSIRDVPHYLLILLNHGLLLVLFALHQHANEHSKSLNMLLLFTTIYFYSKEEYIHITHYTIRWHSISLTEQRILWLNSFKKDFTCIL